ncbi:hypothetical protein L2E82_25628 [Cichorium intybus]|uniref:Uncharacterized protein n=1 Tax=Cichorium intybus TaxID=13427 RepID=A0ACB9E463_CICIN|nr:hypothetical protein L2E82_25628 [Cichorium intybus]
MFTSFSGLSSRARPRVNPSSFARPSVVYSPIHGCFIAQPGFITTPQMPEFFCSNPTMGPFTSSNVQPDLELRLGLLGHTSTSYKVVGTNKVSKSKRIRFSKKCSLTLGHRTWAKTYRKRVQPTQTQVQTDRTQMQPAPIKVRLSDKTLVEFAKNQDFNGSNQAKHKKRAYGPCVRCGKMFDTSQTFASHMRVHYIREETEEEKKERLAKKHRI